MAIESSELRRGNFIHYVGYAKDGWNDECDVVVNVIEEDKIMGYVFSCYFADCRRCCRISDPSTFTAIPFTEEWIDKFGIEEDTNPFNKGGYFLTDVMNHQMRYDSGIYTYYFNEMAIKDIIFVHHLQNLYYALTGEELKII